ncbi:MAG: fluoride efflux transporter CrcB [Bacteroidota bacterium]
MIKAILLVGAGSFAGGVLRFVVGRFLQSSVHSLFPWGTLTVNIAGSFAIGVLLALSARGTYLSPDWKLFLGAGICGGFTTFSTFSLESLELLRQGHHLLTLLYAGSSVVLGLAAAYLGFWLTRLFSA